VIALQPNEGFDLQFEVKTPGRSVRLTTKRLHFRYAEAFDKLPSAYEALLLDVLIGDQSLFVRADWEEASWRLYTPLLERHSRSRLTRPEPGDGGFGTPFLAASESGCARAIR